MAKLVLPRRSFLRGVAAGTLFSIGLPPLEAMFNGNGDALADGTQMAKRFGVWFWGNGIKVDRWVPSATGSNWELTPELEPLADVRSKITVITGTDLDADGTVHHSGTAGMMTGAGAEADGNDVSTFSHESIDVTVSKFWKGQGLPFDLLNVAVVRRVPDKGTPGNISYDGGFNQVEVNAGAVFDRLVQAGLPTATDVPDPGASAAARRARARLKLFGAIKEDTAALRLRLGAADRARLDRHLEGIFAVERRLKAMGTPGPALAGCKAGDRPGDISMDDAEVGRRNEAMTEVMALALACDMTRSFTYQFATWYGPRYLGQAETMHTLTHNEGGGQPQVHACVVYIMGQLNHFLKTLDGIEEGAGTLLDNCAIVATSEVSDAGDHSKSNMPVIIAGKAGGAIRSGLHLNSPGSTYRVHTSLMTAIGMPSPTFGVDDASTSNVVPGLLT